MKIENAEIKATQLGVEDHGIFSFSIFMDGEGWGTWFGGITLDGYDKEKDCRIGWDKAIPMLTEIMNVVGVRNWEDLKGKLVRVEVGRLSEKITKIGNIFKNEWFDLDDWVNKYED